MTNENNPPSAPVAGHTPGAWALDEYGGEVKRYVNDGDLLPDGRVYVLASDYDALSARVAHLDALLNERDVRILAMEKEREGSRRKEEASLAALRDARKFRDLRELLGYVEDGSGAAVTISQDDATRWWSVRAGKKDYHGACLRQAIDAALSSSAAKDGAEMAP